MLFRYALLTLAAGAMATAPAHLSGTARAAEPLPTVEELARHLDDLYRSEASHGVMVMEVTTRRFSRSLTMEAWSRGSDFALVVVREPAREAGNASLKTDQGLWSYGKRSDRMMRIPSGLLGESWMGSHFTNDDLLRETSYEKDYDSVVSRVTEGGEAMIKLEMTPKPDAPVVYTRVVHLVRAEGWLPVRTDYYDRERVVRRMHFEEVRELGGRTLPTRLRLEPLDKPGESTVVTYRSMTFDGQVPASLFTPAGLKREAER